MNSTTERSECAAEGVEEAEEAKEAEDEAPEMECHPCGEGLDGHEAGKRDTIRVATPYKPTRDEVEDHNLTHLPYRSWCRHCIRGRGKETSHQQQDGEDRTVPEFHMDFCFPGYEESSTEYLTVLVARMRGTRMTMSTVVPSKHVGDFITKRTVAFLRECGNEMTKITVKTDQEPAILSIAEDLARLRASNGAGETISENSPTYSHQSNGIVERGIRRGHDQNFKERARRKDG